MPKKILIVGDWVIDEHWVTSVHRSKTKSRPAQNHYRTLHSPDSCTITLAGAGKVASVLHEALAASRAADAPFEVLAVGAWHPDDESILKDLLRPANGSKYTHFRLSSPTLALNSERALLFNVGNFQAAPPFTTRVIRTHQQSEDAPTMLDRIDWELEHDFGDADWEARLSQLSARTSDGSSSLLVDHLGHLDAVIIKDMARNFVGSDLVESLATAIKQATPSSRALPPWFISSKRWQPTWYRSLPKASVRMLIVPQVAAGTAVEQADIGRWITREGEISYEALQHVAKLAAEFPKSLVLVLPGGLSLIARGESVEGGHFLTQATVGKGIETDWVPMATILLPSLVAAVLEKKDSFELFKSGDELQATLKAALAFTETWMKLEAGRFSSPRDWTPPKQQQLVVRSSEENNPTLGPGFRSFYADELHEQWRQSRTDRGVADYAGRKYLDVRRATTEVDGYVCLVESKRRVLRRLNSEIRSFDSRGRHSKAFMLIASPGAGKSSLIRGLARMHGLELLQFNITSMLTSRDLLDCFDTIVTTQARNRHQKLLVFFDEIDAELGQPVFSAFLRPLEDGQYVRDGKEFQLDPCIWIFAGTRDPSSERRSQSSAQRGTGLSDDARNKKGSDFVSRLTAFPFKFGYEVIDPTNFKTPEAQLARLENVYAGVALIKRLFPDVDQVSEAVLEA